ncbi:archease [Prauserella cavernicola]|uniref:Archease n=1 Tax=Prauserella cavernicola TaxID=2800127 RepID=A0A934QVD8_9PSEU|nr:archease [Prauserella cavernicola]MBK1787051.1 archease [Prauserella cavernicola]
MTTYDSRRPGGTQPAVPPQRDRRGRPLHAGDLRIEAWAPTMPGCVAEAVRALADSFLGPARPPLACRVRFDVRGESEALLLETVLRQVISWPSRRTQVAVSAEVARTPSGLWVRCELIDAGAVRPVGAIPKGVAKGSVRCEPALDGWRCEAGIDV